MKTIKNFKVRFPYYIRCAMSFAQTILEENERGYARLMEIKESDFNFVFKYEDKVKIFLQIENLQQVSNCTDTGEIWVPVSVIFEKKQVVDYFYKKSKKWTQELEIIEKEYSLVELDKLFDIFRYESEYVVIKGEEGIYAEINPYEIPSYCVEIRRFSFSTLKPFSKEKCEQRIQREFPDVEFSRFEK